MRILVSDLEVKLSLRSIRKSYLQTNQAQWHLIDPSELLRPEPTFANKDVGAYRDYTVDPDDPIQERVRQTYLDMHTNQTVDFVKGKFYNVF